MLEPRLSARGASFSRARRACSTLRRSSSVGEGVVDAARRGSIDLFTVIVHIIATNTCLARVRLRLITSCRPSPAG